jgi:hypothetical protein
MRFMLAAVIGIAVFGANCSDAQAQSSAKSCDVACLQQKVEELQEKLDALTTQVNKSIKSGQNVTLHTQNGRPGGCHLSRDEWRSGRYYFMERQLFSRRVMDHQLDGLY